MASSELFECEASDDTSENELLERSLSVWRGWSAIVEDFTPIALDIHTACSIGHYDWVLTIIRKNEGIDLDRKNRGGWTPLMYACYIGHDNIVSLLINAGCCNMNARNPRGLTPLMLAASCGNESVARLLIRRGANIETQDNSGWTALFHATYAGHQKFVIFLLEAGANKDAVDPNSGLTPFMVAASEGHEILVQLFLQKRVNAHAKASNGDMARSLALMNGFMKIVSLIDNQDLPSGRLRSDADLYLQDSLGFHRPAGIPHSTACPLSKAGGRPSIRDGPEAIARMINRSRVPEGGTLTEEQGDTVSFPMPQEDKRETRLSYRDVTSPINPEDYRDSSDSRDFDDLNDESNAFTKTGAITIKSSSSSSGGLMAALGLSMDSDSNSQLSCSGKCVDGIAAGNSQSCHKSKLLACRDASLGEDEQQEYDVDGDSSRPVDSHSPSLNETSSLSSSDARQKLCDRDKLNRAGGVEGKEASHPNVKDYFTQCDSSFPPNTPDENIANNVVKLPLKSEKQHTKQNVCLKVGNDLPKENMSQTEIVNRFLDKMSLQECEGPSESAYPNLDTDTQVFETMAANTIGLQCTCANNNNDMHDVQNKSNIVLGNPTSNSITASNISQSTINHKTVVPAEFKTSGSELLPPVNQHAMKSVITSHQLPPQNLTPPLNHHHPLHSRHKHTHNSYYNNAIIQQHDPNHHNVFQSALPAQQALQPPSSNPYLGNLPFMYTDGQSSHFQAGLGQVVTPSSFPTSTNSLFSLNTDSTETKTNISVANIPNNHLPTPTTTNNENHPSSPNNQFSFANQVSPHLHNRHGHQQPFAANVLQPPLLPPLSAVSNTDPSPSVMIPGHTVSQLISAGPSLDENHQRDGPQDLSDMLSQLSLLKYLDKFEEQDVDLQVFLSLTDNDLKELGIKLFGPRKKMTNAIARWHSKAPAAMNSLEQAYADRMEGEMQEMAIQLNQAYEQEECLKAQVLQEQQLRSVTESCLMEERSGWEHASQMLHTARGKLRTLGEQQSRLRHYQKELRKQFETVFIGCTNVGTDNSINTNNNINSSKNIKHQNSNDEENQTTVSNVENSNNADLHNDSCEQNQHVESSNCCTQSTTLSNARRSDIKLAVEQMKRSDKCLKEMVQTLSSLVISTDHILKSMQSLGNAGKEGSRE